MSKKDNDMIRELQGFFRCRCLSAPTLPCHLTLKGLYSSAWDNIPGKRASQITPDAASLILG
ncbi:MAG: hypothetical protein D3923_08350 [Candidatus Electrothrix sp. AR3]|nr:hypothetical protein [Candidatus Electrothrix sp. AR3]